jgi:sRNA-binding regulator protein Hfq
MKNEMDTTMLGRTPFGDNFANRKLIRPVLNRGMVRAVDGNQERREPAPRPVMRPEPPVANGQKKPAPLEQTHAEDFYYQKQIQTQTPMVIVTRDGEQLHGVFEWYDKRCVKLARGAGHGGTLIYKSAIRYMYKEGELSGNR